jgi:CheY-like chemotaxis protein
VLDSGIGIEPRELARLFEAFQQGDSSITRRYGGTGLGLAICKKLVSLMGGAIRAESEPGVGSTFSFMIPCGLPDYASEPSQRETAQLAHLADARVLIVDDNATNRTILSALTRAAKMRPVSARSGGEALNALREARDDGDPIRVAVIDVHMPEVDGFALAEQIRCDAGLSRLPIVFLISAIADTDIERCEQVPGTARLMKPVKRSELIDALLGALERSGAIASAPARNAHVEAGEPAVAAPLPKLRILLVEDSAANRKLTLAILAREGQSAVVAVNGRRAVELCARETFDLVLMDVQMPEMDGLEATAAIRAAEAGERRRPARADHRDDRARAARRPRGVHRRRDGRLRVEADPPPRSGARARARRDGVARNLRTISCPGRADVCRSGAGSQVHRADAVPRSAPHAPCRSSG